MNEQTVEVPQDGTGRRDRVVVGNLRLPRTFSALRHRNYRLFLVGQLISLVGTWMEQTAMGWLIYDLTGSKLHLGMVAAAGTAPMFFLSIWAGSLADRYPKRRILVITQTASMCFAFALAAVIWLGHVQPWQLILFAGLTGLATAFDMPARQAFTIEMTSREDLMNAISLNSSVVNGARIIGPSLAGLLMATTGAAMCFFLNGLSFLAVIAGLLMMRLPPRADSGTQERGRGHALSGLRYIWNHQRALTILTLFGIVGIFGWSYSTLMPAIARDILHLDEGRYGILLSSSSVGALAGALTVATIGGRFQPRHIALTGLWIFSAALLLFSQVRNLYLAMACLAPVGFGMMLFFSTSNTTLQTIVPDEMRGRVMGVWSLVFGAMIPFGSLQAGATARWLGAPTTMAIGSIVCAVAGIITLIIVRRRDAAAAST